MRFGMLSLGVVAMASIALAQTPAYRAPRTADGKPNLNGIWQAMNTANWDLEPHAAGMGYYWQDGAIGAIPPGIGVVEGGTIPYLPAALAKKKENFAKRMELDPEVKCYMPGVPRATYMPQPFQIVQSANNILISYQFAGAVRVINMGKPTEAPAPSWMGWSNGKWEGDTLVVDVTSQVEDSWFDRSGNYHSDSLHVVERYTPRSADTSNPNPSTTSAPPSAGESATNQPAAAWSATITGRLSVSSSRYRMVVWVTPSRPSRMISP